MHEMGNILRRGSLLLGVISLVLAYWGGIHYQHFLDEGGRHMGETVGAGVLALLVFAGSWYGARRPAESE